MSKAKQVVPQSTDYALQAHQISRSSYTMPVMQRRLVYLAMAQVRPGDEEFPEIEMTIGDIARALNLGDSGRQYDEIRAATKGAIGQVLDLDTAEGWVQFPWFTRVRYIKTRDAIKIQLSSELKPYILELQSAFSIIPISDISRLQGRHALRLFELIMSNKGMAGTGGNKPGCWFYDVEFTHLRYLLQIGPTEYKMTADLRKWVVDAPIREINEAGLGIRVECDYDRFRRGRQLLGVRLNIRSLKKGDPKPVSPATMAEGDEAALVAKYPALYDQFLAEERQAPPMFGDAETYAQSKAIQRLTEHDKAQPKKAKRAART